MGIPASTSNDGVDSQQEGISLRDYFAGQALAGILAAGPVFERNDWKAAVDDERFVHCPKIDSANAAEEAYDYADAMLKERDRQ